MKKQDLKLIEVTPKEYQCVIGACASVFKTNRNTYILIGKQIDKIEYNSLLNQKVGFGETAIELPQAIIDDIIDSNET